MHFFFKLIGNCFKLAGLLCDENWFSVIGDLTNILEKNFMERGRRDCFLGVTCRIRRAKVLCKNKGGLEIDFENRRLEMWRASVADCAECYKNSAFVN